MIIFGSKMDITVTYVAREVKTANALDTLLSIVALKYLILAVDFSEN